jgi:hypothetical protein
MSLEAIVIALVVLQIATLSLLWVQQRGLKRVLVLKESEAGGIPALMIVNALNKIDHRLNQLEQGTPKAEAPKRSVEIRAIQMTTSANQQAVTSNYELAQLMARDGSDLDQLMLRCGLSRNEAELMLRLHAKRA